MKKIISIFLVLVLIMCLAACELQNQSDGSISATKPIYSTTSPTTQPVQECVVVDQNNIKFIVTSLPYEDGFWGQRINIYLENNTDKLLMYSLDNVSINGYMVDGSVLFSTEVAPHKKENTSITIFTSALEENKITTINEIEFFLRIYNSEDWFEDAIIEETYKVEFTYLPSN